MINKENANALKYLIEHLKNTGEYKSLQNYFKDKRKEIVEDLIKESGSLEKEALIEANGKLQVYEELVNFDIMLSNDIK